MVLLTVIAALTAAVAILFSTVPQNSRWLPATWSFRLYITNYTTVFPTSAHIRVRKPPDEGDVEPTHTMDPAGDPCSSAADVVVQSPPGTWAYAIAPTATSDVTLPSRDNPTQPSPFFETHFRPFIYVTFMAISLGGVVVLYRIFKFHLKRSIEHKRVLEIGTTFNDQGNHAELIRTANTETAAVLGRITFGENRDDAVDSTVNVAPVVHLTGNHRVLDTIIESPELERPSSPVLITSSSQLVVDEPVVPALINSCDPDLTPIEKGTVRLGDGSSQFSATFQAGDAGESEVISTSQQTTVFKNIDAHKFVDVPAEAVSSDQRAEEDPRVPLYTNYQPLPDTQTPMASGYKLIVLPESQSAFNWKRILQRGDSKSNINTPQDTTSTPGPSQLFRSFTPQEAREEPGPVDSPTVIPPKSLLDSLLGPFTVDATVSLPAKPPVKGTIFGGPGYPKSSVYVPPHARPQRSGYLNAGSPRTGFQRLKPLNSGPFNAGSLSAGGPDADLLSFEQCCVQTLNVELPHTGPGSLMSASSDSDLPSAALGHIFAESPYVGANNTGQFTELRDSGRMSSDDSYATPFTADFPGGVFFNNDFSDAGKCGSGPQHSGLVDSVPMDFASHQSAPHNTGRFRFDFSDSGYSNSNSLNGVIPPSRADVFNDIPLDAPPLNFGLFGALPHNVGSFNPELPNLGHLNAEYHNAGPLSAEPPIILGVPNVPFSNIRAPVPFADGQRTTLKARSSGPATSNRPGSTRRPSYAYQSDPGASFDVMRKQ